MTAIRKKAFQCQRDGLTLRGFEFQEKAAQKPGKLPAVIICHGFLTNQKFMERYAKQFAHWGYAAFTFDFNGGGVICKSDGKFSEMSVLTEEQDLKQVVSYVQSLDYTDNGRLLLMGCSQGAVVCALAAADLKEQIAKQILFYPALCIPDNAREGKLMIFEYDPENIPDLIPGPKLLRMLKLGRCYPDAVMDMDIYEEIIGYDGPILIVHGEQDKVVNVSYARAGYQKLTENRDDAPEDRQMVILSQAGHGFKKGEITTAMAAVRDFLHGKRTNPEPE